MWLHWWESVADCSLLGITFANCSLWSGSPDGVCTASSFWSIFNWIIAQQQIFAHFLVSENVFLLVCYLPYFVFHLYSLSLRLANQKSKNKHGGRVQNPKMTVFYLQSMILTVPQYSLVSHLLSREAGRLWICCTYWIYSWLRCDHI